MNKPLLLANQAFIPYLINGLFVDPAHPRADLKHEIKLWNQEHHAECLAQLVLFPPGKVALRQDSSVQEALQAVADKGMSDRSREVARAVLLSLQDDDDGSGSDNEIEPEHVMLSYQCAQSAWSVENSLCVLTCFAR